MFSIALGVEAPGQQPWLPGSEDERFLRGGRREGLTLLHLGKVKQSILFVNNLNQVLTGGKALGQSFPDDSISIVQVELSLVCPLLYSWTFLWSKILTHFVSYKFNYLNACSSNL